MSKCTKCGDMGAYYETYSDLMDRVLTDCDCSVTRKMYDDSQKEIACLKNEIKALKNKET